MITYALDTNIVSYFLKNDRVIVKRIDEEKNKKNKIVIPPMVYFEIQYWLLKNNSKIKAASFREMYSEYGIGVFDKDVFDIAAAEKLKLREKGFSIEDDDLFIAAYCIKHKLTLVTNNVKHFMNIENLDIINWAA